MKAILLLLGALAFARANALDKLTTHVDALSYVLNLKCLREYPLLSKAVCCHAKACRLIVAPSEILVEAVSRAGQLHTLLPVLF